MPRRSPTCLKGQDAGVVAAKSAGISSRSPDDDEMEGFELGTRKARGHPKSPCEGMKKAVSENPSYIYQLIERNFGKTL